MIPMTLLIKILSIAFTVNLLDNSLKPSDNPLIVTKSEKIQQIFRIIVSEDWVGVVNNLRSFYWLDVVDNRHKRYPMNSSHTGNGVARKFGQSWVLPSTQ